MPIKRKTSSAKRPTGLDTRLPAAKLRALHKLHPRTDATQHKLFCLYLDIATSIRVELEKIDPEADHYELISPARRTVVLIDNLEGEVNNGGFLQYYGNSSGDGAALVPAALREVGQPAVAKLVERANGRFPSGPPRNRAERDAALDRATDADLTVWDRASDRFMSLPFPINSFGLMTVVPFILQNESEFFKP